MARLLLTVSFLLSCASSWARTGSVYQGSCVHAGVRPASEGANYGLTLKISTDWPHCPETRP
jgi:hypothetical protein